MADEKDSPSKPGLIKRFTRAYVQEKWRAYWERQGRYQPPENYKRRSYQEIIGKSRALQRLHHNPLSATAFLLFAYAFFSLGPIRIFPSISIIAYFWIGTLLLAVFHGNLAFVLGWVVVFIALNIAVVFNILSFGQVYTEDLHFPQVTNILNKIKSYFFPSLAWNNPDIVEEEPKKGITFKYFLPDEKYFAEGERASLTAEVLVDGLYNAESGSYQSFPLQFSCYEQQFDGSVGRIGEIYVDDSETPLDSAVTVPAQAQSTYSVLCLFPQGLVIAKTNVTLSKINLSAFNLGDYTRAEIAEGVTLDNKVLSEKIIVLEAKIQFSQTASLKLYTVQESEKPEQLKKVVEDPYVLSDGRVRPRCISGCGGPYLLSLSTGVQPITETKQPKLVLELRKDSGAVGFIERIESLAVALPEGVNFVNTPTFPCDFNGFSVQQEKLNIINAQLGKLLTLRRKGGEEQQDPSIKFQCNYKIDQPSEQLRAKIVQARAIYSVLLRKLTHVQISRDLATQNNQPAGAQIS